MNKGLQILQEQHEASKAIAKEVLGEINLNVTNGDITASIAMEEALESYLDVLDAREKQLIAELHETVLRISAKIAATRNLRDLITKECGIQMGLRMGLDNEEGGDLVEEKTETDAARRADQETVGRSG